MQSFSCRGVYDPLFSSIVKYFFQEPQFYVKLAVSLLLSEGYVRWSTLNHTFAPAAGIKDNEVYLYIMCLLIAVGKLSCNHCS